MSEAKREHSQYHRSTTFGRGFARTQPARSPAQLAQAASQLRLLEAWETPAAVSGDPYNGVGTNALPRRGLHK